MTLNNIQTKISILSDEELIISTFDMELSVSFVKPDVLRLIARKQESLEEETFVLNGKPERIKFQHKWEDDKIILETPLIRVEINGNTFRFNVVDRKGFLLVSSKEAPWTLTREGIVLSVDLDPKERIYGLGQDPMAHLDQRDWERRMWNATDRKRKSGNNGIPFYSSSKPYGFLLNTSYPSRFSIGKGKVADPPEPRIDEKGLERNPFPWPWDQPNPFSSPSDISVLLDSDRFDCFFIFKNTSDEIQEEYGKLTGKAPLPPVWAFGLIQSKNRYRSMEELIRIAEKYRERNLPLNCLVIDWLWFKEFGDYEWDKKHWTEPEKGIRTLNDMGIQVMLAIHPYIDRQSLQYESLSSKGFLNKVPSHGRPTYDFSNPKAREYYWDSLVKKLYEIGVRGFWTDMGEPEDHLIGTESYIGKREKVHNIYGTLWSQSVYEGQRRDFDDRVYILSRAAYAGIQRNAVTLWSNDISSSWAVLKDQPVVGQTVALSGLPYWCTDIGGFVTWREFSPELIIRWYQWGVFCPIFRTHGTRPDNEVWSYGEEAEKIISSSILLRARLLPYVYSCAHMGKPMMRAMWLDFPHDEIAVAQESQYMFGPSFLVAPVTEPGCRCRDVYLPQGLWYDFWTGEVYEGGRFVSAPAPLDRIPLFVKAGSLIPMIDPNLPVGVIAEEMDLYVYPGAEGSFDLVDDDGRTYGYEKGDFGVTEITMDQTGNVAWSVKKEWTGASLKNRRFNMIYPEKKEISVETTVDSDIKDNGDCYVYATVINRTDRTLLASVEFSKVLGWKGEGTKEIIIHGGETVTTHCLLQPDADLMHVRHHGKVIIKIRTGENWETVLKDYAFGSGFPGRFQLIGDFDYVKDQGIHTKTPVEDCADESMYVFQGKEYTWYRRDDYEFNCMGYVYCWRQKIENGLGTVSYGKCRVYSEESQKVKIECSADQAVKIFLDGQVIYEKDDFLVRQILPVEVFLQKGFHQLMVKVAQNHPKPFSGRELGFSIRFLDEKGRIPDHILYGP